VALLSATQTNREGAKVETIEAIHVAEDYNKIRIADLVISINANEVEKTM
jgi:replicative DNA helicase